MSSQAQALLESFDSFTDSEKEFVASEIFHRLPAEGDLSHTALADELFGIVAFRSAKGLKPASTFRGAKGDNELFTQLDSEEATHAGR